MLHINIPDPPEQPEERTLREVVESNDAGVYRVTSNSGNHRVYVNCIGQYFIFNVTATGTHVLVQGEDMAWMDNTVQKTDETLTVFFTKD